jgi:hypothetical protein
MDPRQLSHWLVIGVLSVPGIFVWFLLRRGYSRHVRTGGFLYAAFPTICGLIAGPPM